MDDDSEGRDRASGEDEDCLVLNVWTPGADEGHRPVLVWLHGGGFHFGSASLPLYDGGALAAHSDVVVVGVNHRLNIFGFLHLGEAFGEPYRSSGNAGLLDVVAALRWVRDNIARFGGDPGNVTLMGQSGGGQKATVLVGMPGVGELVHRVTSQSGTQLRVGLRADPAELTEFVLHQLDIRSGDITTLQQISVDRLLAAGASAMAKYGTLAFSPVVDSVTLPKQPIELIAEGRAAHVPLLVGSTRDEFSWITRPGATSTRPPIETDDQLRAALGNLIGSPATGDYVDEPVERYRDHMPGATNGELFSAIFSDFAHIGAERLAEEWVAAGGTAYSYVFAWGPVVDGVRTGATHGGELPALFRNLTPRRNTPAGRTMSDRVSDAWAAFARTGDPNVASLPAWPPFDLVNRPAMVLDDDCRVVADPFALIRPLWDSLATVH